MTREEIGKAWDEGKKIEYAESKDAQYHIWRKPNGDFVAQIVGHTSFWDAQRILWCVMHHPDHCSVVEPEPPAPKERKCRVEWRGEEDYECFCYESEPGDWRRIDCVSRRRLLGYEYAEDPGTRYNCDLMYDTGQGLGCRAYGNTWPAVRPAFVWLEEVEDD